MSGPRSDENPDAPLEAAPGDPLDDAGEEDAADAADDDASAPVPWWRRIDPLVGGAVLLGVLCVAGGLLHAALSAPAADRSAAPASAVPTEPVAAAPAPEPEPTETAAPAQTVVNGHPLPVDCAGLYTRDWTPDMEGLVLSPGWSDPAAYPGSGDETVAGLAAASVELECVWADADAAGERSLATKVSVPSAPQQEAAIARMTELGYSCWEERSGTRCTAEWRGDGGLSGDSHFFRDGIWFATRWVGLAPSGYTHDLVAAVFGD
ncbi:hypothetical protein [Agromyces seonyuensis]|uniref:Uncharacterized protein n=1 Tax=Agromyces seonyuensis TaxID=2662446 RepID=A0A6I4NZ51_9MICO|nr:hypothetical protein [Agromyces seonyuensis]MWB99596.1 hypothetical protein [Agromyces seonyuensis]